MTRARRGALGDTFGRGLGAVRCARCGKAISPEEPWETSGTPTSTGPSGLAPSTADAIERPPADGTGLPRTDVEAPL